MNISHVDNITGKYNVVYFHERIPLKHRRLAVPQIQYPITVKCISSPFSNEGSCMNGLAIIKKFRISNVFLSYLFSNVRG